MSVYERTSLSRPRSLRVYVCVCVCLRVFLFVRPRLATFLPRSGATGLRFEAKGLSAIGVGHKPSQKVPPKKRDLISSSSRGGITSNLFGVV